MDAVRAFIAVALSDDARQQLGEIEKQIQTRSGESARRAVRWVPAANIHLTLKFLGDVSTANLQSLDRILRAETIHHLAFPFVIEGTGAFPNIRRPRVIWAGARHSPELMRLQKAIDLETSKLGYPSEERPFSPHLTLGRVSQQARPEELALVAKALEQVQPGEIAAMQVETVHLFRSDLRPGGPVYTSLYRYTLNPGH